MSNIKPLELELLKKDEIIKLNPSIMEMLVSNALKTLYPNDHEQFTYEEIKAKNPTAKQMIYFNMHTKGDKQFSKAEVERKYLTYRDMELFNNSTKGDDKFPLKQIKQEQIKEYNR